MLTIYCTGLGGVNPPSVAGTATTGQLHTATSLLALEIGGQPASVSFAGLTPGLTGLYQVNATVPEGVAAGDAVPVLLTVGGRKSNQVTMAVR